MTKNDAAACSNEACLSDLALDQIVAGRRPPQGLGSHLARCPRCQQRLQLLEDSSRMAAAAAHRLLNAALAARPAERPACARRRWFTLPRLGLVASATAGVALLVWALPWKPLRPAPGVPPAWRDHEETRIKGTTLRFYVQRDGRVMPGVSGEVFRPGDALRFVVSTGAPSYFFLVGVEDSGKVLAYHPYEGRTSIKIHAGTDSPLPGSLILDDARGSELFVGLFSAEPLSFSRIERAIRDARARHGPATAAPLRLALPGSQHWIVIRKEPR